MDHTGMTYELLQQLLKRGKFMPNIVRRLKTLSEEQVISRPRWISTGVYELVVCVGKEWGQHLQILFAICSFFLPD
jgi:hypothetical protein